MSPITGVVGQLTPLYQEDGLLHAYSAGRNTALRIPSLAALRDHLRSASSGKGRTEIEAKVGSLCEAIERHSGAFQGYECRRRARMTELGADAIHPNACMLYSDQQLRARDTWNALESPFSFVPVPFDPAMEVDWTPVWSLTAGRVRYLPTAHCYYGYPLAPSQEPYCFPCSNGSAAGNNLEEAILQGFCELVERDAVALWWYNRVPRPGVDLDSLQEPYLQQLAAHLGRRHDRELWLLDLTTDLGIPSFAALSRRVGPGPEEILFGFGAHLDATTAALRAVTEMTQMLAWVLPSGAADGSSPGRTLDDGATLAWLRTATLESQPHLRPATHLRPRRLSDFPRLARPDLLDDIGTCLRIVASAGMEMLVLDQTRPDIGLPVVKVFVPGLRHFWARLAPGRLYDVPVKLGWLDRPNAESELNPIPMFI